MEAAPSPRRETGWAKQSRERELTQFPEVWAEDKPPRLAKQVPLVVELKPGTITLAPALGLPDLAKLLTLFFFPFIFISWRLITSQYCSVFCHTLT